MVYLTVDRQLLPDRHELKTVYLITFEMIDNSKRADKMWETRNSNTESSEMTENSKSVVEIGETGTGKQQECCRNGRNRNRKTARVL